MQAVFDTDGYKQFAVGMGTYPVTSFSISGNFNNAGYTTYTASTLDGIFVALTDPSSGYTSVNHGAGIFTADDSGSVSAFHTVSSEFWANAPKPSNLSDSYDVGSDGMLQISLMDAEQKPVVLVLWSDNGSTTATASLAAVPEPGNLLALSGLVLAGGFMRCRRHAAAPRNK